MAHVMGTKAGRQALAALLTGVLFVGVAGCGSALDPNTVADANGGSGQVGSGTDPGSGTDAGTGTGTTGTGTDAGTGTTGTGTTGTGTTATGGGTGATGTGTTAQIGTGAGGKSGSPVKGVTAGSCTGFKNSTGITDSTITIGNASDLSGPVPGLFQAAQDGVRAFIAYFNSTDTICGRKLALAGYDSRTDAGADQQAYANACSSSFAAVGSFSAFDSGGAATAQKCGIPDLRATIITSARYNCSVCFGTQSISPNLFHNTVSNYIKAKSPAGVKNSAMLYLNAGAAAENAIAQKNANTRAGITYSIFQPIDVTEFNYAPYVQAMQRKGVKVVQFLGAYQQAARLAAAMNQQGFKPDLYITDLSSYDPKYIQAAGAGGEGTRTFTSFVPFEEASSSPEMQTYLKWLNQVKPGATPDFSGVYAWSAAELFVKEAKELGGKLTRANLVNAIKSVKSWTGNGIHSAMPVGTKGTGPCYRWLELKGGKWVPDGSSKYACTGLTSTK